MEVKNTIELTVKKVMGLIEHKAFALIDPLLPLISQTEAIAIKLQALRDQWSNESRNFTLKEKRIAFAELEGIEEEIGSL